MGHDSPVGSSRGEERPRPIAGRDTPRSGGLPDSLASAAQNKSRPACVDRIWPV
jgi:hypothetical protein